MGRIIGAGILERAGVRIVWMDSMGSKSLSLFLDCGRSKILIDPGAAVMQPGYPLPAEEKLSLRRRAKEEIHSFLQESDTVIITHYHHDHYFLPSDPEVNDHYAFSGKLLIMKNPNKYINESQWGRARRFLEELVSVERGDLGELLTQPQESEFRDPVDELSEALSIDVGAYARRRKQLLERGRQWFIKLASMWGSREWVREAEFFSGTRIVWGDGKRFELGDAEVWVMEPHFHGVEYDRTGWVTPVFIRCKGYRIFHSSDLMGPIIEDYATEIVRLRPDIVILDGPPTYLFPYMFNRINLRRAVMNAVAIVKAKPKIIIYDHHLPRDVKWRARVSEVFKEAEAEDVAVVTAMKYLRGFDTYLDMVSSI